MATRSDKNRDQELKQLIKAEAIRLGFNLCGFTDAAPPQEFWRYEAWLEKGHQASMKYLESERHRELRKAPSQIFPEVKTIICLGWPTPLRRPDLTGTVNTAWLAAYTGEEDYHQRLLNPMEKLITFIKKQSGVEIHAKGFTDSAPILEREVAVRAGLGWIGKNSCLISPIFGSGFLLAEILLDIDIESDEPYKPDRCGSCRRCMDACPTGCIQADRTIDSSRCIAYLTIENKGTISPDLAEKIGPWIFGCDTCQMVCPWNCRDFSDTGISDLSCEELYGLLRFTEEDYLQHIKNTALSRAKLFGLQRNTLVWLGNHPKWADAAIIQEFLTNTKNPVLIETGRWALKKIQS